MVGSRQSYGESHLTPFNANGSETKRVCKRGHLVAGDAVPEPRVLFRTKKYFPDYVGIFHHSSRRNYHTSLFAYFNILLLFHYKLVSLHILGFKSLN